MELGFLAAGSYGKNTSSLESISRVVGAPTDQFSEDDESTQNVNVTGNLNLGWAWFDEHSIESTSLLLRNTDDKALRYSQLLRPADPLVMAMASRKIGTRYEQRELQ